MSTRQTITLTALLFLAAGAAFAQQEPSKVSNDAFSITLPAGYTAFTSQTKSADSKEGKIDTTTWVAKSTTGQIVIVAMTKMPGRILDPEKMIASTRDALLKSLNATVESEEKIPGDVTAEKLLFKSNTAQPVFVRTNLIVTGDRQYQVIFIGHSDTERTVPAVASMFDSFQAVTQTAQTSSAPAAGNATSTTTTVSTTTVGTATATTTAATSSTASTTTNPNPKH